METLDERAEQVWRVAEALQKRTKLISKRLDRAARWNDNLDARVSQQAPRIRDRKEQRGRPMP